MGRREKYNSSTLNPTPLPPTYTTMKLIPPLIGIILTYVYGIDTGLLFCIAYGLASIADILNNKFPTK